MVWPHPLSPAVPVGNKPVDSATQMVYYGIMYNCQRHTMRCTECEAAPATEPLGLCAFCATARHNAVARATSVNAVAYADANDWDYDRCGSLRNTEYGE